MVLTNYKCSQQELFAVARTGWNACTANLSAFTGFKTKYSTTFIAARLQEIDAAEKMPDAQQREEDSRSFRIDLKNKAYEVMARWKFLKRYIIEAFPADKQEVMLDAAGQSHYRKAGKDEWTSVQRLIADGSTFIEENKEELINKGSMPEGFMASFVTTREEYDLLFQQYLDASLDNPVNTEAKIIANNKIFADLMTLFLDGQELFRNSDAVKKKFTFEQVLLTVAGPGGQGIKGNVSQAEKQPVPNAQLIFTGSTSKTVMADEYGHYDCSQLKEGLYTVTVTAPGLQPTTITDVLVVAGTMKILNIVLL